MAALAALNPTFIDVSKAFTPGGALMDVAEILNTTNEMDEITWAEGNLLTGHMHSMRTGLPAVTWGQLYKGVQPSKGTRVQVTDTTGWMESLSEIDARLVELAPDGPAYRAQEDVPHVESMGQEFYRTLFKGTAAEVEKFIGFEARFNDSAAANAENIIDTDIGEDTDLTSIWLIGWSPSTVFCFGPKGMPTGLQQEDWGKETKEDASGGLFKVWRTYFRWTCGLAMPDWRYVVRAQVDESELVDDAATGVSLPKLLRKMIDRLPAGAATRTRMAFYMNRTVKSKLAIQMEDRVKNSTLVLSNVGGVGPMLSPQTQLYFDGIPVRRVDALAADETLVIA